jgi:putative ABC transport system permease protein
LISTQATLSRGQEQYDGVTVMAVDTRFPDIYQYDLAEGAFIDDENDRRRESVVVLGVDIAEALFPDEGAIGERIRIFRDQARSFKVIGVMKTASDSMGMSFDTSVYIPVSTYDARLQKIDGVMRYGISADRDADVLEVSAALENWFLTETGDTEAVRVMSPATMAEMFKGVTETLNLFLTGVAAISLLVGGIGIMNIMLVSVTERTREIGVRKALGATPRVIRRQFLVEAAALTTLGGTLGVFVGLGVSAIGVRALGWNFTANIGAVAAAVVFSAAVGLFFGLYPAARASRLDPVEALAYE